MYIISQSNTKYLDLGDIESFLPLVVVLVDSLRDTIWELAYGLVLDHP